MLGRRASNRDITQRKRAEQALSEREARYRAFIETMFDGFTIADAEGRFLEVNDAYVQLLGHSRKELLGMRISDVEAEKHPDEIAAKLCQIQREQHASFESLHRKKDGTVFPVEINVGCWPASGGCSFAFIRDISERKSADEALRQREAQYRAIIETSPDAFFMADPKGHYLEVNDAFVRRSGYGRDELLRDAHLGP